MVVELISGERVIGRIMPGESVTVVILSDVLGTRTIALEAVKAIHPISSDESSRVKAGPDRLGNIPKTGADKSDCHKGTNLLSVQLQDVRGKGSEASNAADKPAAKSSEEIGQTKTIGQKPEDEEDMRKIFFGKTPFC